VDGPLGVVRPTTAPDAAVDGTRLWRLPDADAGALVGGGQLLIADGHHRYETALAFGEDEPGGTRVMALFVSTGDPGLHAFPTHRVFAGRPELRDPGEGERVASVEEALALLAEEPHDRAVAVAYRKEGVVEIVRGNEGELDVELVDRHGLDGITYTPQAHEAVATVDSGDADAAYLLREPRLEDVFAVARRGGLMPSKSTYFFPKPLSGLLFHPVES
jgi:hypothetical protein